MARKQDITSSLYAIWSGDIDYRLGTSPEAIAFGFPAISNFGVYTAQPQASPLSLTDYEVEFSGLNELIANAKFVRDDLSESGLLIFHTGYDQKTPFHTPDGLSNTEHSALAFASPGAASGYTYAVFADGTSGMHFGTTPNSQVARFIFRHEMAHVLGLSHPYEDANRALGEMGYTLGDRDIFMDESMMSKTLSNGKWHNRKDQYLASQEFAQTALALDIAALQSLYGADYSTRDTDTTYSWDPLTGGLKINGVLSDIGGGGYILQSIWDGGGVDTYDFSSFDQANSGTIALDIRLSAGGASVIHVNGMKAVMRDYEDALVTARHSLINPYLHEGDTRSLIENAIGTNAIDFISGNQADNVLDGRGGDDTLYGGAGNDTLKGGAGNDRLIGGSGDDHFHVGLGYDYVYGGAGEDTAHFDFLSTAATFSYQFNGVVFQAKISAGGNTVEMNGIEKFKFSDVEMDQLAFMRKALVQNQPMILNEGSLVDEGTYEPGQTVLSYQVDLSSRFTANATSRLIEAVSTTFAGLSASYANGFVHLKAINTFTLNAETTASLYGGIAFRITETLPSSSTPKVTNFTIGGISSIVNDVYEFPFSIPDPYFTVGALGEGQYGTWVGEIVLNPNITKNRDTPWSFDLIDDSDGLFEIVVDVSSGYEKYSLRRTAALDHEASIDPSSPYLVTIRATDGTQFLDREVQVTVTNSQEPAYGLKIVGLQNTAPVNAGTESMKISEDALTNMSIGRLIPLDQDVGNTHTFYTSDALVGIQNGDEIYLKRRPTFQEIKDGVFVQFSVSDNGGGYATIHVPIKFAQLAGTEDIWNGSSAGENMFGVNTGPNKIDGGAGNDNIFGYGHGDILWGGANNDTLSGGGGMDTLDGGTGNDILLGGSDADTFVFYTGSEDDEIRDYQAGSDKLQFLGGIVLADLTISNSTKNGFNGALIEYGNDSIFVRNATTTSLLTSDFEFL